MNVVFLDAAREELEEATAYYERQREGLGEEFAHEVEQAVERIRQFPEAWSRLTDAVWRCKANRFPYGVVYTIRDEDILLVAVMHMRRKPGYWADRL
jgi:plasmid stabilization system protein ParE